MERNTIQEMREILDAIAAGKTIQCRCISDGDEGVWKDAGISAYPNFFYCIYRIKPEEPKKVLRPFKDTAELFAANGGHDILWLKSKTSGECRLVLSYGNDYVKIQCKWNMNELMREYTFKDGRPCGVLEDA